MEFCELGYKFERFRRIIPRESGLRRQGGRR